MVGYQLSARQLSQEKHFMVKARAIDREFELARVLWPHHELSNIYNLSHVKLQTYLILDGFGYSWSYG